MRREPGGGIFTGFRYRWSLLGIGVLRRQHAPGRGDARSRRGVHRYRSKFVYTKDAGRPPARSLRPAPRLNARAGRFNRMIEAR